MVRDLAAVCASAVLSWLPAQCPIQGITLAPHAPCGGGAPLFVQFSAARCALDFFYLPFPSGNVVHGAWLAIGVTGPVASYPLVLPGCSLLQAPILILPIAYTRPAPIPPGLAPLTLYVDAFGLFYEPNTMLWTVQPGQSGWQITLW